MPQEMIAVAKYGYLFQGQHYSWQRKPRGRPGLDLEPSRFVNYLQNHDQVANSAHGLRGHQADQPGQVAGDDGLLLLLPGTPMLFQGQEFSASAPFLFFADFDQESVGGGAEGTRRVPDAVSQRRRLRQEVGPGRSGRASRRSNAASSISQSEPRTPLRTRCTAICSRCDGTLRRYTARNAANG